MQQFEVMAAAVVISMAVALAGCGSGGGTSRDGGRDADAADRGVAPDTTTGGDVAVDHPAGQDATTADADASSVVDAADASSVVDAADAHGVVDAADASGVVDAADASDAADAAGDVAPIDGADAAVAIPPRWVNGTRLRARVIQPDGPTGAMTRALDRIWATDRDGVGRIRRCTV